MLPNRRHSHRTDPYRSTGVTPSNELIDHTPTPAQLDARRMRDAHAATRCHYIKPSGERCGSPAMNGLDLCYYHDRYKPKPSYRNLPCLEDPHSVQCAIQEVIEDMLNGLLDYKKAALALYGLQTAASNLKQMRITEEKKLSVQRSASSEEEINTGRTQGTRRELELPLLGGTPSQDHDAGLATNTTGESRRDDWLLCAGDNLGEFEHIAGECPGLKPVDDDECFTGLKPSAPTGSSVSTASSCVHSPLPTTNDQRPTTPFVESPRQPQHVRFGLTSSERTRMKEMFPDMKKIREEFLASLTAEERAMVEQRGEA